MKQEKSIGCFQVDVRVDGGKITALGRDLAQPGDAITDASGQHVLPVQLGRERLATFTTNALGAGEVSMAGAQVWPEQAWEGHLPPLSSTAH